MTCGTRVLKVCYDRIFFCLLFWHVLFKSKIFQYRLIYFKIKYKGEQVVRVVEAVESSTCRQQPRHRRPLQPRPRRVRRTIITTR